MRPLEERDLAAALEVVERDPVANVFVGSRLEAVGLTPRRLGAEIWGWRADGRLSALCYAGANVVPVQASPAAAKAFAQHARRQGRRCSSIVGPGAAVDEMWRHLSPAWGPARELRRPQPLLAIGGAASPAEPLVAADPAVRRVRPEEVDLLLPAAIAMFTEEVGVSPVGSGGRSLYRARLAELVAAGRSFARIEDGRVLFKADVGAATRRACQVQGVWVDPQLRGRGIGTSGMAAVVRLAQESVAPVVSLYVNDFNLAARAAYRRVGFTEVGTFTSVLF